MGPVGDDVTAAYLGAILGEQRVDVSTTSRSQGYEKRFSVTHAWRPKASAHALQQLETGRAILIEGQMPPAVIRLVLWWRITSCAVGLRLVLRRESTGGESRSVPTASPAGPCFEACCD